MTKHKNIVKRAVSPSEALISGLHVGRQPENASTPSSGGNSPMDKPKSPKFMSRLMEHNPLHKSHSTAPHSPSDPQEPEVKHRSMDIAKKLRRKVNTPSAVVTSEVTEGKEEKKNKKKLRKFITSVYQERLPDKPAASSTAVSKGPVFGVALEVAVQRSRVSERLPLCRVFQDSIMYIETFALTREGIYRVPGFRAKLNELKTMYNKGEAVKLTNYDPETVGMLLKLYLRELPEPLLTRQLGAQFEGVLQYEDTEQRTAILCAMLRQLPAEHYATLAWLCLHINHVSSHEKENKMTLSNLIIILSPTLLISNTLLRCLCENAECLFPGVVLDPNKSIPTQEELKVIQSENAANTPPVEQKKDRASEDHNLQGVRDDLVQSYVWAQARNDALKYVKEQLRVQLQEEKRQVSACEEEMQSLEEQDYVIGDTVVLRESATRRNKSENETTAKVEDDLTILGGAARPQTEEDMQLYLSTLEQMNNDYESDKTNLYNTIISETFACIEAYTEIRFRQTFAPKEATGEA